MKRMMLIILALVVVWGCARNRPVSHQEAHETKTATPVAVKPGVVPEYLVYVGQDCREHTVHVLAWAAVGEPIGKDAGGRPLHRLCTRWDPHGRLTMVPAQSLDP